MAALYSFTLFLSAALLFWVQPMVAKMLLPLLGGSPSVWNTCMVFFQAMLLAGYAYAHVLSTRFPIKRQVILHLFLLAIAVISLPLAFPLSRLDSLPADSSPVGWLLVSLLFMAGLPFFMISSTGPLLQRWFSRSNHPQAHDPYFLYSASNLGSLLALLAYPLFMEPLLRLPDQSLSWAAGYSALIFLILGCGTLLLKGASTFSPKSATAPSPPSPATLRRGDNESGPSLGQGLHWILLAFVPSSLMLGVTSFFTTDIASIPLLWIVPLSLYLVTFILVFARHHFPPRNFWIRLFPFAALGLVYLMLTHTTEPAWLLVTAHLLFFFVASMVCHGRLAADRPPPRHLTTFYLLLSVGGVLGGVFNALVAPSLFQSVIEYPLVIVLACALLPAASSRPVNWSDCLADWGLPVLLLVIVAAMAQFLEGADPGWRVPGTLLVVGLPCVVVFLCSSRPLRYSLATAALLVAAWHFQDQPGRTLHVERNFYGVSRVMIEPDGIYRQMLHGNTFHGLQFTALKNRCDPLAYYHRQGPFADIMKAYQSHPTTPSVAVIGLGAGAMVSYSRPQEAWTFYEIDPAVLKIAQDTNYFTFLEQCGQGTVDIVKGDARLQLQKAPDHHYGLIVLDAFSSDAIPVHLITREALDLYVRKLAPGGMLAFHISNRYLSLEPVVGNLAAHAGLAGLACFQVTTAEESAAGKPPSHWAILTRNPDILGLLMKRPGWKKLQADSPDKAWTDDYSNILSVFQWR